MTKRYVLAVDESNCIIVLLPVRQETVGITAKDNRLFIDAFLYRYGAGIPLRDLTERFGDFHVTIRAIAVWQKLAYRSQCSRI